MRAKKPATFAARKDVSVIQEAADESMQSDSDYGVKNKRKRVARK